MSEPEFEIKIDLALTTAGGTGPAGGGAGAWAKTQDAKAHPMVQATDKSARVDFTDNSFSFLTLTG
jgi:hypothetical protein